MALTKGGLGIRSIEKVNKALLEKWLWRVGEPDRIVEEDITKKI